MSCLECALPPLDILSADRIVLHLLRHDVNVRVELVSPLRHVHVLFGLGSFFFLSLGTVRSDFASWNNHRAVFVSSFVSPPPNSAPNRITMNDVFHTPSSAASFSKELSMTRAPHSLLSTQQLVSLSIPP